MPAHPPAHLLCWHSQLKVEAAHQHGQGHSRLKQGKLVADTLASTAAKGDEGKVRGDLIGVQGTRGGVWAVACGCHGRAVDMAWGVRVGMGVSGKEEED